MVTLGANSFITRFVDIVAVVAQWLPVVHAPEQFRVALVGNDVVDKGCDQRATVAQILAPRIYSEERFAFFPPAVVVPALVRSSSCHFNNAS